MQFSYNALLVAALGVDYAFAQPANRQKQRRDLADVNWSTVNYDGVNWATVNYGGAGATSTPVAAAVPAATTSAVAQPAVIPKKGSPIHHHHHNHNPKPAVVQSVAPAASPDSSDSSSGSSGSSSGLKVFGQMSDPIDNGNKDQYIGNVGKPYGSNMILLDSVDKAETYTYSNTFNNPTSGAITVIVWNKSGKDRAPQSGMGLPPNLEFSLGPNESKAVAFQENSQVAFSQDCERDPMSNIPNCTWGELDFGDLRNGGWSGYDRSSIPNSAGNTGLLTISCKGAKTSSQDSNSFTSAAQTNAGGSLAPGAAHFFTTMGA